MLDCGFDPEAPASSPVPSWIVFPTRRGRWKGSHERSAGATCGEETSENPSSQPLSSRAEAPKCMFINKLLTSPGLHPSPWEHDQGFSFPVIHSLWVGVCFPSNYNHQISRPKASSASSIIQPSDLGEEGGHAGSSFTGLSPSISARAALPSPSILLIFWCEALMSPVCVCVWGGLGSPSTIKT